MADIAIDRVPRSVRGRAFTKQGLRRALLAGLAGVFVVAGARFGYDWWTVGRFIETTDDAYVGSDVSSPRSWSKTMTMSGPVNR